MKKNNLRKAVAITAAAAMTVVSTSAFAATNTRIYGNGMFFNQNQQMFGGQQLQQRQQGGQMQMGGMQPQPQQNGAQFGGNQQMHPQQGQQNNQPQQSNNQSVFGRIQDFGGQMMDRIQQMNPFGGQQQNEPQQGQQPPQMGEMPQNGEQPTPPTEQQPEVTEAPAQTEALIATETPVATEKPVATEAPEVEVRNDEGVINLNGDSIDASGVDNVTVDGSTVTITAAGEYTIAGTLLDGQIAVELENKKDEVTLNLDGVTVINTTGNAFNATKGKVTLNVNEGSSFTSLSTGDDQTAIFSKNDLTIKGAGKLTAISESGNGIRCKNDLDIGDVDLVVNAGNNGIKGDESVKITKKNRSVTVTAGGDGIKTDELPSYDEETGEYVSGGVITVNGGNVTVNASGDGIQSDTLLTVNAGTLDITAGGEALKSNASSIDYLEDSTAEATPAEGDGCIVINGGSVNAKSGEDGIKATKDVTVNDGTVIVKSAQDGIQAGDSTDDDKYQVNGTLTINGGTLDITSGGGHTGKTNPTLSESMKGIKSNYQLTVNGGNITVNSRDDSVHCDYRIDIAGGTLTLDSDDDGVHADSYLYVSDNADINVKSSYEGLEAAEIYMSGGSAKVVAKDDGVNAAGDNPNGTKTTTTVNSNNRGGFGGFGGGSSYGYIEVSGGYLYIDAEGDGFDSNGNCVISGGTVIVNGPTTGGNGVFDVGDNGNTLTITGGTVIGVGTSDMAVTPSATNGSQAYVVTTVSTQSAGKAIKLTDASGNTIASYTPSKSYSWVLISTPDMTSGQSYTLTYGSNQTTLTAITSGGSNGMGGMQPGGRR